MLSADDYKQIEQKGIKPEVVERQLKRFEQGFDYLEIVASASVRRGIFTLDDDSKSRYISLWDKCLAANPDVVKFVPASGAASRMFKDLFEFLNSAGDEPVTPAAKKFFGEIASFAFYDELDACCRKLYAKTASELLGLSRYKEVAAALLTDKGLSYGNLPKGVLTFHKLGGEIFSAFSEHLSEGALYAKTASGKVRLHFTVSPEHRGLFEQECKRLIPVYESRYGAIFEISFSEQKPSTDTIAADKENRPFREEGKLVFRPGGHGALIENLNETDADIIFIKNIDNVASGAQKEITVGYKKVLAGLLVEVREQIYGYMQLIDSGQYEHDQLIEIIKFLHDTLCIRNPLVKEMEDGDLVLYLREKLNRPLRVCGMVRNEGEAGGGPFLAMSGGENIAPQIVESSQINLSNPVKRRLFEESTHFNPVDLVCSVKDYQGNKFNLTDFIDPDTGFISLKSKNGVEQKALELPGLWNGAMADWNTIFVEVPIDTFTPVKTVNDLLRKEHQEG